MASSKDLIISGLIGGLVSVVFYPIITFFSKRFFISSRIQIKFDNEGDYKSLRVVNNSFSTLENVIAYITIDNCKDDILINSDLKMFCHDQVKEDRLSWAKNVDGKNQSEAVINQGESQKLNVIVPARSLPL